MSRPLLIKSKVVEHVGGKSVTIMRDCSVQAEMVRSALRRKRKNDVRNSKAVNDVSVHSVDSNVSEPVLPGEGSSEGETGLFRYDGDIKSASWADIVNARGFVPTEEVQRLERERNLKIAAGGYPPSEYIQTPVTEAAPKFRVDWADSGAGLCESDGVGRGQESALRGEGGDSSLSDQSS